MAGRSTVEQILNVRIICEKYAAQYREYITHSLTSKKLLTGFGSKDLGQL